LKIERLRSAVKRFSVPLFFIFAYAISWTCWLFTNRLFVDYEDVLQGAKSILLVSEIPLAFRIGILPAILMSTYGPAISAIILTALMSGKAGLREFFGRIVRWRIGIRFYLAVTLLPLALHLLPYGVAWLLGGELPSFAPISLMAALGIFISNFLRSGGQEELGFRGFAQPRLREKFGAIGTSVIIGVLWFLWHFPLYIWISGTSQYGISLVNGVIWQVAATFLFTWVYDRTDSILIHMLLHASINSIGVLLPAGIPHPSGALIGDLTRIVSYALIGIVLILKYGSKDKPAPSPG
jgi:membrane protease YdiL (CAAX protease family)